MGDELQLVYHQGTLILKDGKVIRVEPAAPGPKSGAAQPGRPGGPPGQKPGEKADAAREETRETAQGLWKDLESKREEMKGKLEEKKKGIQEFESRIAGYRTPKELKDENERLEESLGITKLKQEIAELERQLKIEHKKSELLEKPKE